MTNVTLSSNAIGLQVFEHRFKCSRSHFDASGRTSSRMRCRCTSLVDQHATPCSNYAASFLACKT